MKKFWQTLKHLLGQMAVIRWIVAIVIFFLAAVAGLERITPDQAHKGLFLFVSAFVVLTVGPMISHFVVVPIFRWIVRLVLRPPDDGRGT
jgi:hypothetical protein